MASLRRARPSGGVWYRRALERLRVIGVDVGGTKTLCAVLTREGEIEARVERHTVVTAQEALLAELDNAIDQRSGRAIASVNIPLADLDFRERMRERHGLPVALDNDGKAAAIAEWKTGAGRGATD